jgi:hypothetical protein
MSLPSEEESNQHYWRTFEVEPLAVLRQRSLIFRQSGVSNQGGPCIVTGATHLDALGSRGAGNVKVSIEYEEGTRVVALTTAPGGDGTTYWYPYIERGVGECDISYQAAVGTTALTAGMNGCSLRIYANPARGLVKFCHDNNGEYADDARYAAQGFIHVQSVNANSRMRGDPSQNINNYWEDAMDFPQSGVFFICMKTSPTQWSVFQSAVIGSRRETAVKDWLGNTTWTTVHPFSGGQRYNKVVVVVDIPPHSPAA